MGTIAGLTGQYLYDTAGPAPTAGAPAANTRPLITLPNDIDPASIESLFTEVGGLANFIAYLMMNGASDPPGSLKIREEFLNGAFSPPTGWTLGPLVGSPPAFGGFVNDATGEMVFTDDASSSNYLTIPIVVGAADFRFAARVANLQSATPRTAVEIGLGTTLCFFAGGLVFTTPNWWLICGTSSFDTGIPVSQTNFQLLEIKRINGYTNFLINGVSAGGFVGTSGIAPTVILARNINFSTTLHSSALHIDMISLWVNR